MENEEVNIGQNASDVNIGENASGSVSVGTCAAGGVSVGYNASDGVFIGSAAAGGVHVGFASAGGVHVGLDAMGDVRVGSTKSALTLKSKENGTTYETTLGDLLEQLSALKAEVRALKDNQQNIFTEKKQK